MVNDQIPGIYVDDAEAHGASINGIAMSTAGFVGLTSRGPIGVTPLMLTSLSDFERYYGRSNFLVIAGEAVPNYLLHAVRGYFDNGGSRLYVARVLGVGAAAATAVDDAISLVARQPGGATIAGTAVNFRVMFKIDVGPTTKRLAIRQPAGTMIQFETRYFVLGLDPAGTAQENAAAFDALPDDAPVALLTMSVTITDCCGTVALYPNLGFHPSHARYALRLLGPTPPDPLDALTNPVMLTANAELDAFAFRAAIAAVSSIDLLGGSDGTGPPVDESWDGALALLGDLEDIAIIAAPGASSFPAPTPATVNQKLIASAELPRAYQFAVLDTPAGLKPAEVAALRAGLDSSHAALYYPWIAIANPQAATDAASPADLMVPPSGFICGTYARTEAERGLVAAPINLPLFGAVGVECKIRSGEQDVLDPLGINCIRAFADKGIRVWGARTTSSDSTWKYVSTRRYFLYLEASLDHGMQWAIFEPNGERLWDDARKAISNFLQTEWRNGALQGATPNDAFLVRCDRTTMSQEDLDSGRLVCLIGAALLKAAEFISFRFGQLTATANAEGNT